MKDAVKITVIATGFREIPTGKRRPQETRTSFAAAHDDAMDFPEPSDPRDPMPEPLKHIMSGEEPMPVPTPSFISDPGPMPVMHSAEPGAPEVISLDTMRNAIVSNFEQDDLDVPAFLRKRNEVM